MFTSTLAPAQVIRKVQKVLVTHTRCALLDEDNKPIYTFDSEGVLVQRDPAFDAISYLQEDGALQYTEYEEGSVGAYPFEEFRSRVVLHFRAAKTVLEFARSTDLTLSLEDRECHAHIFEGMLKDDMIFHYLLKTFWMEEVTRVHFEWFKKGTRARVVIEKGLTIAGCAGAC